MNKLAKIIDELGEEDLLKIKRDLVAGNIDMLITKKLHEKSPAHSEKFCPVCGGEITKNSLILEFGSDFLRRKAYFDGIDCLEYFVSQKIKNQTQNHE